MMNRFEQRERLAKISDTLGGIFDGISAEFDADSEMYKSICEVERDVEILLDSFNDEDPLKEINYFKFRYTSDSEEEKREYTLATSADMMRKVCQMICFSDCTDEVVSEIVLMGRKIRYSGWQPDMLFEFVDCETNEVVWSNRFVDWTH